MFFPEDGIGIVRAVAATVVDIIVHPVAGLCIEPVRDIAVRFLPRQIADEAKHGMLPFRPPA